MATNAEAPPAYQEKEAAPPAYQEKDELKATKATGAEPGGDTAEKQNQPPPDAEGEFGEPMKRFMWIGAVLLLYCILAFWLPVYWMDYYANWCDEQAEVDISDTYCATYSYLISDCNLEELRAAYVVTCEAGFDALDEIHSINQNLAGYSLMTIGIALVAVGVILGYFGVKQGNRLYQQITAGLLGIGGLMAMIGIILIIAIPEDPEETAMAALIIRFVVVAIPASVAMVLAYDVFNPYWLATERNRMLYCTSIIFIIFGLMGGICYAYIANYEADGCLVLCAHPFKDEYGCIAAGYLILAIVSVIRILIFEEKIQLDPAQMVTAKLVVSVLLILGGFICAVGYWAYIDSLYDLGDSDTEDQNKCYYIGLSFFILGMAIINSIDMGLVQHWKACQAAQAASSAANSTPAADGQTATT